MAFEKPVNNSQPTRQRKTDWIDHVLRRNCLLKYVIEGKIGREDEEEDVSNHWMISRKSEDIGILNCKD
jgi:hypothetical protein